MEGNVSDLFNDFNEDKEFEKNPAVENVEKKFMENIEFSDVENEGKPALSNEPNDANPSVAALATIKDLLENLTEQFESKLKYDKHKDEIIDKLHTENQAYKNDLFLKIVSPFINEVIILIDDYSGLYKKHAEMGIAEINVVKLLKQFGDVSEDLEELLNKNGIESFTVEGDTVDFTKQKVIKTVPTDVPEKDKTIHERLKKGFSRDGKVIRQEHVSCYRYENKIINNQNTN